MDDQSKAAGEVCGSPFLLPCFKMRCKPVVGYDVNAVYILQLEQLCHKVFENRLSGDREQGFGKVLGKGMHTGGIAGAEQDGNQRWCTPFTELAR